MSPGETLFTQTIVLDQEAFQKASHDLDTLSADMETLRADISNALNKLSVGFDTPAGRLFMKSCKNNLLDRLQDQADVIKHVSDNLNRARTEYESVFTEFEKLNNSIKQI